MSYTVLARKWRPKKFTELVGQAHVMQALANALDQKRLHHAYLFTGTRGVGKTTIARIFSKALNCEQGMSSTPCGVCDTCRSIDEGRFIDLIEVDAASKTKVDDTREILDNVQFAPTQGRFKVYLIDEVHMLSKSSFNALLKTLEEPPEHVKFLLATTDPHKLPITVLSRCLQFNLMRLTQLQIQTHLEFIMGQEGLPFESSALALIAKGADGSARDALSLLDQAIAYGAGEVLFQPVQTMLGLVDQQYSLGILQALSVNDPELVKQTIQQLASMGVDYQALLSQLIETLHALSYYQVFGDNASSLNVPDDVLASLAVQISPERVQLLYQIALLAKQDMQLAPDIRIGFEMALIRMLAFQPAQNSQLTDSSLNPAESVLSTDGMLGSRSVQSSPNQLTGLSSVSGHSTASQSDGVAMPLEAQNALAGLATARSLVGKKIVPRTDFIKEDGLDSLPVSESVNHDEAENEFAHSNGLGSDSFPAEAQMVQTIVAGSFSSPPSLQQGSAFDLSTDLMPSQGVSESSAPPWDLQFNGSEMAYNSGVSHEGYFSDSSSSPALFDADMQNDSQGYSEHFTESFIDSIDEIPSPQVMAGTSNTASPRSSSDHLAQIKERLKQPLGKPSKASSTQDSLLQKGSTEQIFTGSTAFTTSQAPSMTLTSVTGSASLQSVMPANRSIEATPQQSSVMSALSQLQAVQHFSGGVVSQKRLSGESFKILGQMQALPDENIISEYQPSLSAPMSSTVEQTIEEYAEISYITSIENWMLVISQLALKGMAAEVARNSVLVEFSENYMAVSIDPIQDYSNQEAALSQFDESVKTRFGASMVLSFVTSTEHFTPARYAQQVTADKQSQAVLSISEDSVVHAFSQQLGMQVIPDSIQPV